VTEEELKRLVSGAVSLAAEVAWIIRDYGPIPSGMLYARVMSEMDLPTYNSMIDLLVNQGLIRRGPNHLLVWVGPTPEPDKGEAA
jgi:hypothetical protein